MPSKRTKEEALPELTDQLITDEDYAASFGINLRVQSPGS